MRPIGFSTGALARGDFEAGLAYQRDVARINAIELSALRDHELPVLVEAAGSLRLDSFEYVSFHAPSKLNLLTEQELVALLMELPIAWPIVVHPDVVRTTQLWRQLGARICLENMDNRKAIGRTVEEMSAMFEELPEAMFCFDIGHARQVDPTMTSAARMLRELGGRLRQVHVSDVGPRGEHLPVGSAASEAFHGIARSIPAGCPLIIESVIEPEAMLAELDAVGQTFAIPHTPVP